MIKRLSLLILFCIFGVILGFAQQKKRVNHIPEVVIPDTLLISTDKGSIITSRYYALNGQKLMRISYNNEIEKSDTTVYDEMGEYYERYYKHEVYLLKLRNKPIEQINDREAFDYFAIGDSIQDFTRRLGNKKVHVSYTGYQLTFPDEITKKPQVIEFVFWDGVLTKIERITKVNTLPTNDVWTAFQLMQIKESLNDLEQAVKLLRSKSKKKWYPYHANRVHNFVEMFNEVMDLLCL